MGLITVLGLIVLAWLLSSFVDGLLHLGSFLTSLPSGLIWVLLIGSLPWFLKD
jgi:hypothetical protein